MAMSESRRRKLDMLMRSLARKDVATARDMLRAYGHSGVNRPAGGAAGIGSDVTGGVGASAGRRGGPMGLEEACPGAAAMVRLPGGAAGEYYLIRRTLAQVAPQCVEIGRQYAAVMKGARQILSDDSALSASPELCRLAGARCEDLLFMDIETCGLTGAMVFLAGMMRHEDGQLVFEQCFAKDYSQEPAVLAAFMARHDSAGMLVTFNGKAFDMNLIRERSAFHRLEHGPREVPHLDLLHESRRRWKSEVPNCKLQTLERLLCGRRRVGDIPGPEIPEAYHRFVASGDARQVADIIHHNLLDLLTMAQLVTAILTGSGPLAQ
jgi:uncharacterized protein YprB with RNaseH-like and TPR domain